jgi:transcriptional regulator NrdR family protein
MPLSKDRLKAKIKAAFKHEQTEQKNADDSLERISDKLAQAIIEEIKETTITYISGLTAGSNTVAGTFKNTIS